jgi:hypothetical protein
MGDHAIRTIGGMKAATAGAAQAYPRQQVLLPGSGLVGAISAQCCAAMVDATDRVLPWS